MHLNFFCLLADKPISFPEILNGKAKSKYDSLIEKWGNVDGFYKSSFVNDVQLFVDLDVKANSFSWKLRFKDSPFISIVGPFAFINQKMVDEYVLPKSDNTIIKVDKLDNNID